jgi:methyl-accepting chemotaxis protein
MIESALIKRSAVISILVGSFLTLINQFDAITSGATFSIVAAMISYAVPFCVSLYSGISASRA